MKKLFCVLLALLSAAVFCACADRGGSASSAPSEAPIHTFAPSEDAGDAAFTEPAPSEASLTAAPTEPAPTAFSLPTAQAALPSEGGAAEEPPFDDPFAELIEGLLPEWKPYTYSLRGRWYSYRGFGFSSLRDYIEECAAWGFSQVYAYENNNTSRVLYRDDIWIEISDNTHNEDEKDCYCTLYFHPRTSEGGLTADEARALAGDPGIGVRPCAVIELSPEGLYAHTGMQLFRMLFDLTPACEPYTGKRYTDQYFLVGGKGAVLLGSVYIRESRPCLSSLFYKLSWGDVDEDGEYEAVMMGLSLSSSEYKPPFVIFRAEDGKPKVIHSAEYVLSSSGLWSFDPRENKLMLNYAEKTGRYSNGSAMYGDPYAFRLCLENGRIKLYGPEDSGVTFTYAGDAQLIGG